MLLLTKCARILSLLCIYSIVSQSLPTLTLNTAPILSNLAPDMIIIILITTMKQPIQLSSSIIWKVKVILVCLYSEFQVLFKGCAVAVFVEARGISAKDIVVGWARKVGSLEILDVAGGFARFNVCVCRVIGFYHGGG